MLGPMLDDLLSAEIATADKQGRAMWARELRRYRRLQQQERANMATHNGSEITITITGGDQTPANEVLDLLQRAEVDLRQLQIKVQCEDEEEAEAAQLAFDDALQNRHPDIKVDYTVKSKFTVACRPAAPALLPMEKVYSEDYRA